MIGSGKYDTVCTGVRVSTKAAGAMVMVIAGDLGDGFSIQVPEELWPHVPTLLRVVAEQVENDYNRLHRKESDGIAPDPS